MILPNAPLFAATVLSFSALQASTQTDPPSVRTVPASSSANATGIANGGAGPPEVVGPFTVLAAPVEVNALILSSFDGDGWLNIVDRPVTVVESLSGFPMIDDGLANLSLGTTIDLSFASGAAFNGPGDDCVLLDARFSLSSYAVSASYDGFLALFDLALDDFVDTGVDRTFAYGHNSISNDADVWGNAFDLSDVGVPLGQSTETIRLFVTADEADLLGLGVLQPPVHVALVIGTGGGFSPHTLGPHTFVTQLDNVDEFQLVDVNQPGEIVLPLENKTRVTNGLAQPVQQFHVQLLMWNSVDSPAQPEQWSRPMRVVVFSDGRFFTSDYGDANGVELTAEHALNDGGQPVLRFPYSTL